MKKIAIISGITGQDGSFLAELLLSKGYEVHGIIRRHSATQHQTSRIDHIFDKLQLHYGDLTDMLSVYDIIKRTQPTEIYHLGAQSHVRISFENPTYTMDTIIKGALSILESVRMQELHTKIYFASSSEMFGNNIDDDGFQRETTKMDPVSPYGIAKLAAYQLARNYRQSYNMFVSNGILFNHESPRRGGNFVTNKVVRGALDINEGITDKLALGNLQAARDWGHAKDYVRAMYLMLQCKQPGDYVCATGISHSVQDLVEYVFNKFGLDWKKYIKQDSRFLRPKELNFLRGDSTFLRMATSWMPEYTFETMMDEMIDTELGIRRERNI